MRASRGAEPMMSATTVSSLGLERSSENSCTPAGRLAQEAVEGQEGEVGIAHRGKCGEKLGHQLGQQLARLGAARCGITAEMPAADGGGDFAGRAVAHARQGFDGLRVILAAGEDKASGLGAEFLGGFEQPCIMALHAFQRAADLRTEGFARLKA